MIKCLTAVVRFAVAMAIVFVSTRSSAGQPVDPPAPDVVLDYVAVLSSDASTHDKAMACRALSVVGDERAVSDLAKLLEDEQLAAYARTALESIPGEAAGQALRDSLDRVQGDLLVGVLSSIGKRRDSISIAQLSEFIDNENAKIAEAAARALGRIGNPQATQMLGDALRHASPELRPKVAWACLDCAMQREKAGDKERALELYHNIRDCDLPQNLVLAATERVVAAQGERGRTHLADLLKSSDEHEFRAALQMARTLGTDATSLLRENYERLPTKRQLLVLIALGDLGDPNAVPVFLRAADDEDPDIRSEGIMSLARFDSPTVIAKLFSSLTDCDELVAATARDALVGLKSAGVDSAIVDALNETNPAVLPAAIDVAGQRRVAAATAPLFTLLEGSSANIRSAAIRALGSTVELRDLPRLIRLAIDTTADERDAAISAIATACARLPQQDCAEQLIDAMTGVSLENQVMLLEQLAAIGNRLALETVVKSARSDDDRLKDAAI